MAESGYISLDGLNTWTIPGFVSAQYSGGSEFSMYEFGSWYDPWFELGMGLLTEGTTQQVGPQQVALNYALPQLPVPIAPPVITATAEVANAALIRAVMEVLKYAAKRAPASLGGITASIVKRLLPFLLQTGVITGSMVASDALARTIQWWWNNGRPKGKTRRMNPLNPRALKRSTRRLAAFSHISKQVNKELAKLAPPRRSTGRGRTFCGSCGKSPCGC